MNISVYKLDKNQQKYSYISYNSCISYCIEYTLNLVSCPLHISHNSIMQSPSPTIHESTTVVFGIPIEDDGAAKLVKKVMNISTAMAALACITAIIDLTSDVSLGLGFIVAVVIPCLGWQGARKRSVGLLRAFAFCNSFCACVFLLNAMMTIFVTMPEIRCLCDTQCRADNYDENDKDVIKTVNDVCPSKDKIITLLWVSLLVGAAMAVLQVLGFKFGRKLMLHSYIITSNAIPVAPPVHTTPMQPQMGHGYPYPQTPMPYAQPYGAQPGYHPPHDGHPQQYGYSPSHQSQQQQQQQQQAPHGGDAV